MINFESKYLRYLEAFDKYSNGTIEYEEFHRQKVQAIDAYLEIIKANNWSYELFLDSEFKRLLGDNGLNSDYKISFSDGFYNRYKLNNNENVLFLFFVIHEYRPKDISDTLIYVANILLQPGKWRLVSYIIEALAYYNNPKSLFIIEDFLKNIEEDYLTKDILYDISGILVAIHDDKAISIIKSNINSEIEVIREEMEDTLSYFKKEGWI